MLKYLDIAIANEKIKTIDIKGKEYSEVNQRIKAFRSLCPNGSIITELLSNENGVCVIRAVVRNEEGVILGTGIAYEKEDSSFINKTSYIENCETSAVGRALGMCGFGIDVSVASAEEVANAMMNQEMTKEEADSYTLTFGRNKGKTLKETYESDKQYIEWILSNSKDERLLKAIELSLGFKVPTEEEQMERLKMISKITDLALEKDIDLEDIKTKHNVNNIKELTNEDMKACIEMMEGNNE